MSDSRRMVLTLRMASERRLGIAMKISSTWLTNMTVRKCGIRKMELKAWELEIG